MNSAFRREARGRRVAITGTSVPARARKSSRRSGSKSGRVTAKSAPASTFQAKRLSSSAWSAAAWSSATPATSSVGAPMSLPPASRPRFRRCTTFTRPMESMSEIAVESA